MLTAFCDDTQQVASFLCSGEICLYAVFLNARGVFAIFYCAKKIFNCLLSLRTNPRFAPVSALWALKCSLWLAFWKERARTINLEWISQSNAYGLSWNDYSLHDNLLPTCPPTPFLLYQYGDFADACISVPCQLSFFNAFAIPFNNWWLRMFERSVHRATKVSET